MSKIKAIAELKEAWSHMKNPDVAAWKKVAAIGAAGAYVAMPVDVIPDFLPVIGQLDDVAVAYFISKGFNAMAQRDLNKTHEQQVAADQDHDIFDQLDNIQNTDPYTGVEYTR